MLNRSTRKRSAPWVKPTPTHAPSPLTHKRPLLCLSPFTKAYLAPGKSRGPSCSCMHNDAHDCLLLLLLLLRRSHQRADVYIFFARTRAGRREATRFGERPGIKNQHSQKHSARGCFVFVADSLRRAHDEGTSFCFFSLGGGVVVIYTQVYIKSFFIGLPT